MPDEIDMAQTADAEFQQHALGEARYRPQEAPLEEDGVRLCLECETPIIKARLAAYPGAVRCIRCQEREERR